MTKIVLRVGILVPRFAPFRGGMETYVASAASALAAEGVDVTVITQAPRAARLQRHETRDGYAIERHHLPVGDVYDIPAPSAARAAMNPGRFDVVWLHSYHTPLAWIAAEKATVPIVFTPHYHGVGHTPVRRALHRAYRPAGRRLMAAARHIVVDTDAEASLVLRDFPGVLDRDQVVVVPPVVVNPIRGQLPCSGGSGVVLTVARQEPYKRTDLLIHAIAQLHELGESVRLVIVGEGSALDVYKDLTEQLGVRDVVTFTGSVDNETLGGWWASASLYATASEQEAYGIGLAEALLSGLPAVASDIPAHREVVNQAGPRAAARLVRGEELCTDTESHYASAILELLSVTESREMRAVTCALADSSEVVEKLIEILTTVGDRARL